MQQNNSDKIKELTTIGAQQIKYVGVHDMIPW